MEQLIIISKLRHVTGNVQTLSLTAVENGL